MCRIGVVHVLLALLVCIHTVRALQLQVKPLIGGPSWLPLHVSCVVEDNHKWDFIPLNATSSRTLQSLLSLQSVPGEIRYHTTTTTTTNNHNNNNNKSLLPHNDKKVHQAAHQFVQNYNNRNLHLITNNCWTFALMLYWHLLINNNDDATTTTTTCQYNNDSSREEIL